MPTKTKEYSLYDPGCLVVCKQDIYSSVAIDGDGGGTNRVQAGTVGLIISGPQLAYNNIEGGQNVRKELSTDL